MPDKRRWVGCNLFGKPESRWVVFPRTDSGSMMENFFRAYASWLTAGVVIVAAVSVAALHGGRSLWNDEVWIIDVAAEPTLSASFSRAIDIRLSASPGYLTLTRLVSGLAEGRPWAYRVPPAVFGVAMLITAGWVLGQWVGSRSVGMVGALILLASPLMQRYLTEAKQYMIATAISIGLVAATQWWAQSRHRKAMTVWLGLAAAGVLMSFSAWYAVAGTGLVLWLVWLFRGDRVRLIQTTLCGVALMGLAAMVYFAYARPIANRQSQEFATYWGDSYPTLGWSWPVETWQILATQMEKTWYLYSVPGSFLLLCAIIGWGVWCRWQPVGALAGLAAVAATVAASTLRLWPLEARINLPTLLILHLSMLALPLSFVRWMLSRQAADQDSPVGAQAGATPTPGHHRPRSVMVDLAALCAAVGIASLTLFESSRADYEVAKVVQLLDEVAKQADPAMGDLVLLDWTPWVNHRLLPRPIQAPVRLAPWPDTTKVVAGFDQAVGDWSGRYVFVAAGHHNAELARGWGVLAEALSTRGQFEMVWAGRLVALYRFERGDATGGE